MLLTACAGTPPALPERCVWLAPRASWCLAPVSAMPRLAVVQRLEAELPERRERFIGQLELTGDALHLAALSPLGQRLFVLHDDGRRLDYRPFAPLAGQFAPGYVLADLQLMHWPFDALAPGLAAAGLRLTQSGGERRLWQGPRLLARVRYSPGPRWPARVEYENLERRYRLTSTTLEVQPLENRP
ncbi:MAG: DUF3261 domain-containing protein [Gammaproteobacteria bacterium]|nr:DUF3261 domain-containing protein [Gammaproteobacteria bacterium]